MFLSTNFLSSENEYETFYNLKAYNFNPILITGKSVNVNKNCNKTPVLLFVVLNSISYTYIIPVISLRVTEISITHKCLSITY